jgi:hypothetical protein
VGEHTLDTHAVEPFGLRHALPQLPQLFGFVARFASHPSL